MPSIWYLGRLSLIGVLPSFRSFFHGSRGAMDLILDCGTLWARSVPSLMLLVTSIDADEDCLQLLLEAWYLDDGVLAAERSAVIRALHLIEDLGPHLGLYINFYKGELFNRSGNSLFPPVVKSSLLPNLDIAEKCAMPKILLKASNNKIYGQLNLNLVCANATATLSRIAPPP